MAPRPESASEPSRRATAAAAIVLIVLAFIAYGNTLRGEFVWDDASSILLHRHVKDPSKFFSLFAEDQHAFAGGQGNFYRPLVSVTFLIDYALSRIGQPEISPETVPSDLSPTLFHVSNILWHAAAAIALFAFLGRVGVRSAVRFAVSALFVVHPLHTEAVAYVSGRADSMAAAFVLAALYFATWDESPRRHARGTALTVLAFTAALLSKESALIFPALLALSIAFVPRGSPGSARPMSRWTGFFFCLAVAAGYAALRSAVLNFGAETGTRHVAFGVRLTESLQALALYLKLVFVPTGLHMERTLRGVSWPAAVAGGVLIATMLTLVWMTFRTNRRRASFGFAWFLLTWLPISGLFPLNAPMAEHWMYLPLPGLLLGLAEVVDEFAGRTDAWRLRPRRVIGAIVGIWFIAMILLTVARNRDWHDNESLYLATLRKNSESTRVQFNLGVTYQDILDNPAGARRHFENVVAVYERRKASDATLAQQYWTEELEAHLSLGELYRKAGRYTEAIPHYGVLLAITANAENSASIGRAAYGIGRCYLALGEYEAARAGFRRATELVPALGMQAERDMAREAPLAAMSIR